MVFLSIFDEPLCAARKDVSVGRFYRRDVRRARLGNSNGIFGRATCLHAGVQIIKVLEAALRHAGVAPKALYVVGAKGPFV